jgi:hypothetical protein
MTGKTITGERQSIGADQAKAWVAEGERAARVGDPIESNPYEGRDEQLPRLMWLRGYLYTSEAAPPPSPPRWG